MTYNKTNWVDGVTPVSAQNMNKLETQYDKAKELVDTHKADEASKDSFGHVKVGDRISVIDGVISADQQQKFADIGNTILFEYLNVISKTSQNQIMLRIIVPEDGKYRITGESRSNSSNDNGGVTISTNYESFTFQTYNSTFVAFTCDLTFPISAYDFINFASVGPNGGAIKDVRLRRVQKDVQPSTQAKVY